MYTALVKAYDLDAINASGIKLVSVKLTGLVTDIGQGLYQVEVKCGGMTLADALVRYRPSWADEDDQWHAAHRAADLSGDFERAFERSVLEAGWVG